jgi:hypothetical protein
MARLDALCALTVNATVSSPSDNTFSRPWQSFRYFFGQQAFRIHRFARGEFFGQFVQVDDGVLFREFIAEAAFWQPAVHRRLTAFEPRSHTAAAARFLTFSPRPDVLPNRKLHHGRAAFSW